VSQTLALYKKGRRGARKEEKGKKVDTDEKLEQGRRLAKTSPEFAIKWLLYSNVRLSLDR